MEKKPEVILYGKEKKEQGYNKGYFQCQCDQRRRKNVKERGVRARFGEYFDRLDDIISANRKK